MRVLACGDRNWTNKDRIREVLKTIDDLKLVIEGTARGADTLAGQVALELGAVVWEFPADWDRYGKAAGPIRNIQMLDAKPDLVIAFHNNLAQSRGTRHTVTEANKRRIPVRLVTETDIVWEAGTCKDCGASLTNFREKGTGLCDECLYRRIATGKKGGE